MPSNNPGSMRYKVWLEQANFDYMAAKISHENGFYEWACYQSVQAVEKAVKAVIVYSGFRAPKIHKLGILLSIANHSNKAFFEVKFNFRKLESYTFVSRYPFIIPNRNKAPHDLIFKDDAQSCLEQANQILRKIDEFIVSKKFIKGEKLDLEHFYFTEEEVNARINDCVNQIVNAQKIKASKIILFGSFAREKTRPKSSTMDIMIIGETDLTFFDRIEYIREVTKGAEPIVEPIVYTSKEFEMLLNEEGEGFLETAVEEGRVIFEQI